MAYHAYPRVGDRGSSIDWVPAMSGTGRSGSRGRSGSSGTSSSSRSRWGLRDRVVGLSLFWTFVASTLGIFFGTVFMALHATQGPRLGMPQMVQSRAQFGYRGVIVPLFATLFTFLAFNVVDQILIAAGVEGIFGWDATVVAIARLRDRCRSRDLRPRLAPQGLPDPALHLRPGLPGADHRHRERRRRRDGGAPGLGFSFVGFMVMFTVAAGYNITYAPYVSDYSGTRRRRAHGGRSSPRCSSAASGPPIWLIPLGAWLASRLGADDALVALRDAGDAIFEPLGTLAAIMSVLALVATMGINAYSAMLSVVTGIDSVRKVEPTRRIRVIADSSPSRWPGPRPGSPSRRRPRSL